MLLDPLILSKPTTLGIPIPPAPKTQPTTTERHSVGGPPLLLPTNLDLPIAFRKGMRSCTQHPIVNHVSFDHLSPYFRTFTMSITPISMPKNYQEALLHPD